MVSVPVSYASPQSDLSLLARPITLGVIVGNRGSSHTISPRRVVRPLFRLWKRRASRQSFRM